MGKKLKTAFSAVLIAALVLVLGACSKEDKVEMGISTGTLKEAAQDSITISTTTGRHPCNVGCSLGCPLVQLHVLLTLLPGNAVVNTA